jgi:hypothetical protein
LGFFLNGFFEFLEILKKNNHDQEKKKLAVFFPFNCCLELGRSPPTIKKSKEKDQKC